MDQRESLRQVALGSVRYRAIGVARILFGAVWAIDALLKWQPSFSAKLAGYLTDAARDRAPWVVSWVHLWLGMVTLAPTTFGVAVALIETVIAVGLLTGAFSNLIHIGGGIFSLFLWSTAEGFGWPGAPGPSGAGTALCYFILFLVLFAVRAGTCMGVDRVLTPRLGRLGFLASGPLSGDQAVE